MIRLRRNDSWLASLFIGVFLAGCGSAIPPRCGHGAFSIGASHMTNSIPTPFVVSELRGKLVPDFLEEQDVDWIPAGGMRFQVNGPDGAAIEVAVAADGSFHVPGIAPGRYCFRTSSQWFQGYEGVIVIDPRGPQKEIVLRVAMGA
jgi:hypothetical protein